MYINGEWTSATGSKTFDVINPFNGEIIGTAPDGGTEDANRAVDAAAEALPLWSGLTAYERSSLLYEAWRIMMDRWDHLAKTMTTEQGKPLKFSKGEVKYGADFLLWYAEEAKRVYGETIPAPRKDQRFMVMKKPVGVVAAITPWNYPISMITRKAAPALAAGCTLVLKPAEDTPLCAIEIFKIFQEAGIPPGVVNLVTAKNPAPVGSAWLSDRRVRKITFTGSTPVGKMIAEASARQMKRVSLELGGHAPFLVLKDADPVFAAKGCVLVKFLNTGQACISPNRIYVHKDSVDAFVGEFSKRTGKLIAGNGLEGGTSVGPLVNEAAVAKIENQVADAVSKGATVVCGGKRLTDNGLDKGFFYAPTVLTGVTKDMLIYREETFGPVAPIIPYDDDDDLLAMANDTDYGLAAYIYTRDLTDALTTAEGLSFGIIGINDINPTAASAPFGGVKESGLGREGGKEGIGEYLDTKLVGISI